MKVYSSMNMISAWNNSSFIYQGDQISTWPLTVHAFLMRISTIFSVKKILVAKYINWSTNFRKLPFNDIEPLTKQRSQSMQMNDIIRLTYFNGISQLIWGYFMPRG